MGIEREYDLVERMRALGAEDPEGWAASELSEDLAQEARWLIIRQLRPLIPSSTADLLPYAGFARLLEAGVEQQLVVDAAQNLAREIAFAALHAIDEGHDPEAPDDVPGWILMETRENAAGEQILTGRTVDGLHESLLSD